MKFNRPSVTDIAKYDEIIDVRSPAEFAEDHIPGAINYPVLDDQQRIEVGTLYKQVSPFEAKKVGAAMISENIAHHLRTHFLERPKSWKPLIYCWRGGDRSGSMCTIFRAIGWSAGQLDGGYKGFRRHVIETLETLPETLDLRVLCGPTGSAKTRILQAIGGAGEQILDLEGLACHKGSVLGILPEQPQPSQKAFETALYSALSTFDPARPVYVEAESRKIGQLHLPETLIASVRAGCCIQIQATLDARIDFLLRDYDYFFTRTDFLIERLNTLRTLISRETLSSWQDRVLSGEWPELTRELLLQHYDPLYQRSQEHNFSGITTARSIVSDDLSPTGIERLAREIIQPRIAQIA